jgi:four helix bundle protein
VVTSYRDLKVWQAAMKLAELAYGQTEKFPQREAFGLRQQLEKAAVSVPSNIAEGHARDSTKEYLHHVSIALGSVAELETQTILALRLKYIAQDAAQELLASADEVGKMLRGLQKSLKARL